MGNKLKLSHCLLVCVAIAVIALAIAGFVQFLGSALVRHLDVQNGGRAFLIELPFRLIGTGIVFFALYRIGQILKNRQN